MRALVVFLFSFTLMQLALGETCNGERHIESESALLGAGFSAPPDKLELPTGWRFGLVTDRILPLPLDLVDKVGLIQHREIVGQIVLGNADSERLWSIDLTLGRIFRDVPIETQLSIAIVGGATDSFKREECAELEILNELLGAYSTPQSSYAFRLGQDIALDAGFDDESIWTVMWRDSSGDLSIASWRIDPGQVGILRGISREAEDQSLSHPIQKILDCASSEEHFDTCRAIRIPGVEVVAWPPEDE